MTAIAGIVRLDGQPVDRATIQRMQNLLAPYGRDNQHHWVQGHIGLLRTLLRTTPEDSLDRQPLYHAESNTRLIFDGRIDNRDDLIRKLGFQNQEANFMADSQIVMHAILRWDSDAVQHFVGDFALACWNQNRKRLWLARDPLGHRPLFWHSQNGFFAFATLPKALFAIPGIPRAICEERLSDLLTLIPMIGPESFFKDVYRVEPGQLLILDGSRITTQRYHHFDHERQLKLPSDDDYLEAFREKFNQAVFCQLRSNGPIASHLSSGLDSSTVTAVAAQQLAPVNKRLLAYTAVPRENFDGPVPPGRHADESPMASALAARFPNIDHVLVQSRKESPLDSLQEDIQSYECAPLNPCNMAWINAIHDHAENRSVKVLLTGLMGNMSISYTGEQYLAGLLGKGEYGRWWREITAIKRAYPNRRRRGLIKQSIAPYLPGWLWNTLTKHRNGRLELTNYTAIHADFMARIGTMNRVRKANWDLNYKPWADSRNMRIAILNRVDIGEHQAGANLWGLDVRDPTSDLRLIEFCLAIPEDQYFRKGETSWLLKRLMGNILPPEILNARTKGLQAADWYESLQKDMSQIKSELQRMKLEGVVGNYLDLDKMLSDLESFPDDGWGKSETIHTYRQKLLRGLSAGSFINYVETNNNTY